MLSKPIYKRITFLIIILITLLFVALLPNKNILEVDDNHSSLIANRKENKNTIDLTSVSTQKASVTSSNPEQDRNHNYIVECKKPPALTLSQIEAFNIPNNQTIMSRLSESEAFEPRLAFALALPLAMFGQGKFGQDPSSDKTKKDKISLLESLLLENKKTKMLHYFLVSECIVSLEQQQCPEKVFNEAIVHSSDNAAFWLQMASHAANTNNESEVVYALKQLIAAPNHNEFWADTIDLFDASLEMAGVAHTESRLTMSIGYAAALSLTSNPGLFKFCRENTSNRADLAQLCLDAGRKQLSGAKTFLGHSIGATLQKVVHEQLGQLEMARKIEETSNKLSRFSASEFRASQLMSFDAELQQFWLSKLRLFGESESFELVAKEAIRLSSNPDYDPCPNGKL